MKNRALILTAALGILFVTASVQLSAQQAAKPPDWSPWRFLLGEWVGEGGGEPGQAAGSSAFMLDLQNTILVRKNLAQYQATADRPATRHEDFMIIYQEKGLTLADYFDNEGHVIHYMASVSSDSSTWTFLSEALAGEPRYRLIYAKEAENILRLDFDVAQPGKPEAFSPYIQSRLRRK